MRRFNVGNRAMFFGEMGLNIPDEAFYHPVIKEMQGLTCDLVTLDNVSSNRFLTRVAPCNPLLHLGYGVLQY